MKNLDLIILTLVVTILYMGFAITLFKVQKKQQDKQGIKSLPIER